MLIPIRTWTRFYTICDGCGAASPPTNSIGEIHQYIEEHGWQLKGDMLLCPCCVKEAEEQGDDWMPSIPWQTVGDRDGL